MWPGSYRCDLTVVYQGLAAVRAWQCLQAGSSNCCLAATDVIWQGQVWPGNSNCVVAGVDVTWQNRDVTWQSWTWPQTSRRAYLAEVGLTWQLCVPCSSDV